MFETHIYTLSTTVKTRISQLTRSPITIVEPANDTDATGIARAPPRAPPPMRRASLRSLRSLALSRPRHNGNATEPPDRLSSARHAAAEHDISTGRSISRLRERNRAANLRLSPFRTRAATSPRPKTAHNMAVRRTAGTGGCRSAG